MKNPFTLSFGKKPVQFVSRLRQENTIIEEFRDDEPSTQVYMLTGPRGAGKTVMMSSIAEELQKDDRWIVIELNAERDILPALASKLYAQKGISKHFIKAKVDFSAFGLGASIEDGTPVTDIEMVLEKIFEVLSEQGRRVLLTIDEVTKNANVRVFAATFQILIRKNYPVFLLMTGLYENIYELQNEKSLTFLFRAPKVALEPLNAISMQQKYADVFDIPPEEAREMAEITKGYPFAFQVLGYLRWEGKAEKKEVIIQRLDEYLAEYVYDKIWSELSEIDLKVVVAMAATGKNRVKDIREELDMTPSLFSVYRDRLKRKGVIDVSKYGTEYQCAENKRN